MSSKFIPENYINKEINGFKIKDTKRENRKTYLLVVCPYCKKEKWMRADGIISGRYVSCGCYNIKNNYIKSSDLTDKKFGRLTAKYPTQNKASNGSIIWFCKCECGNTVLVSAADLMRGRVRSCGCLKREINSKVGKSSGKNIKDNYCINGTNINNLTAKISKNNTSGIKGVTWDKSRKRWVAQIEFQGKHYYLGRFTNKEDARKARESAEKELFGNILKKYKK
jgi:hypothetical protein